LTYKPPSAFLSLLIAGALLRLFFVFALPLYPEKTFLPGYNDEPLHLNYIRHIAEYNRLPIWYSEESETNPLVDEFGQAPLYYLIAVPFFWAGEALHTGWGLYGARLLSLCLGIIAAQFVYWSAQRIVRDERIALAAMAAALFAPNNVSFTSLVTNDAGLACLCAMAFHSLLLVREGYGGVARQIKTGVYLGLAAWMKVSALALFPLGLIAIPFVHRRSNIERGDAWMGRWRVLIVAVALVMPLIVWQSLHYGPGMLEINRYSPQATLGVSGGGVFHPLMALKLMFRTAAAPFDQVWGSLVEKGMTSLWLLFAGTVSAIGLFQFLRSRERWMIHGAIGLTLFAFLLFNIRNFQVETRLFIPMLVPLAILAGSGCEKLRLPLAVQVIIWALPILSLPYL